jgi:hypothetical protein
VFFVELPEDSVFYVLGADEAKGGDMTINNLRPICAACNGSMGTMSMNEFTTQFFGWSI